MFVALLIGADPAPAFRFPYLRPRPRHPIVVRGQCPETIGFFGGDGSSKDRAADDWILQTSAVDRSFAEPGAPDIVNPEEDDNYPFGAPPNLKEPVPFSELDKKPPPSGDPGLAFGPVGPRPDGYRWSSLDSVAFLTDAKAHGPAASGPFGVFQYDTAWTHAEPDDIFQWTSEFNYRSWSGPTRPNLPPNAFRLAADLQLALEQDEPVSYQIGFTPALVSDFDAPVTGDAFNWDVRGAMFLRATPEWTFAFGAAYWNRVDHIVVPYAGVIWAPDERLELRLMFPNARINWRLKDSSDKWSYAGVEYHVEAYQIDLGSPQGKDEKIQLADYRAVAGIRDENSFLELGCVFNRQVTFKYGTPDFDINPSLIIRFGLRH